MLYGHGDDAALQTREIRDDFSINIRPDGPPSALMNHLRARMDVIARYPEPDARSYRRKLATTYRVTEANLLVTSGGTAAIYLVAQAFRAKRSLIVTPTFSEYADAADANDHEIVRVGRAELAAREDELLSSVDLVWLCNPNNPTGEATPAAGLLALVDRHPDTLFVIDQAFAEFCAVSSIEASAVTTRPNLILLRSFTKTLGIPGLRLGCILASAERIDAFARTSQPWAVNSLAIEAGLYHLAHPGVFAFPIDDMLANARALARTIGAIPGFEPKPSATTFFLVELKEGRSDELKEYLVEKHGILIRDAANFHGLGPQSIRISSKTPWKNTRLAQALAAWKP